MLRDKELRRDIEQLLSLFRRLEYLEKKAVELQENIGRLEEENRKLKYEYGDSLLNRDKAMPYKWKKRNGYFQEYCPKCEMMISNWQGYCASCGQKIRQGNPEAEMEMKEE